MKRSLEKMNVNESRGMYRILDASANRVAEGLRTLEEYTRFVLEDSSLTERLKQLRHAFATALGLLSREELLMARDTPGDVGTELGVASEYERAGVRAVVMAAASRVQQSLRSLEEYGKVVSPEFSREIERVRYQCYEVCASIELRSDSTSTRRRRLEAARLYVLSDACVSEAAFTERLRQCIAGGVDVVQLRDRGCTDRVLIERACLAMKVLVDSRVLFIVNDRVDIAIAASADGVHVGQDEMPVPMVRSLVGQEMLIGLSTHSLEQAREAVRLGADYIGCGPVFPSRTKAFDAFVGPELLREVQAEVALPAFAIGGISSETVDQVTATGMNRIAVSSAVCDAVDVVAAAERLKQSLGADGDR